MSPRRVALRTSLILLAGYLSVSVLAGIAAAEFSLHPPKRPLRYADLARATAARYQATLADVAIDTPDGARLRAWFARPKAGNNSVVMLFHGVSDNREGAAGF